MEQDSDTRAITANPEFRTRRVVTGHDAVGRSIIASDDLCATSLAIGHPDCVLNELWRCDNLPADNADEEPTLIPVSLAPPPRGNLLRTLFIPPEAELFAAMDKEQLWNAMGPTGKAAASGVESSAHPLMHRTNTTDYIIVLEGEVHAVMESGEVLLRKGDVLVQRGTNHAWSNRTDRVCLIAVVLNGAMPIPSDFGQFPPDHALATG